MQTLNQMIHVGSQQLHKEQFRQNGTMKHAIAPYRICPIGAHVDHQGGAVLGKSIALYTVLSFQPAINNSQNSDKKMTLLCNLTSERGFKDKSSFEIGKVLSSNGWSKYAEAAAAALNAHTPIKQGITGVVSGSLIGAGLSSSASVILAYIAALCDINQIKLNKAEQVELVRRVENEFMGLNNGIQDQTAIAYGRREALNHLDSRTGEVQYVEPEQASSNRPQPCWVIAYSGFSRMLVGSGFNTRVDECRQAAKLLDANATILSDIPETVFDSKKSTLPAPLDRRASHYFSEQRRVAAGRQAWEASDWERFGALMNQSCQSSIHQYESGSPPLIDLSLIAASVDGVYGARFSGGGYGGCVVALAQPEAAAQITAEITAKYLEKYPEKEGIAHSFITAPEDGVRVIEEGKEA